MSKKKIGVRVSYDSVYKGRVARGRARYLLNIVYITLRCSNHLFSVIIPESPHSSTVEQDTVNILIGVRFALRAIISVIIQLAECRATDMIM